MTEAPKPPEPLKEDTLEERCGASADGSTQGTEKLDCWESLGLQNLLLGGYSTLW